MKQLWAFALLAACAKAPEVPAVQGTVPGLLRNPTAPLASQVDVTAARLEGDWFVRQAAFGTDNPYDTGLVETSSDGSLSLSLCQLFDCDVYRLQGTGDGRWAVSALSPQPVLSLGELWVLWMDFDERTVAIGDTLGRYVWIMDVAETGGADRITAAREILEWYGYDLSQLETVQ